MIEAYKIIELDSKDNPKMLFHGLNGSRIIPKNTWLTAEEKMVRDGTSKTYYLSGWHVLLERQHAVDYLKAFKNRLDKLRIIKVLVKDIRPKEHSPSPVFLAKHMLMET
jgi:hypothetical protein